ncbi:MAG: GlxA family transcriptional regulator [Alphaproteobacteria bacterium]|nr:GlxA family transcriptional regulator [Alphaproteobacteria bacterium]
MDSHTGRGGGEAAAPHAGQPPARAALAVGIVPLPRFTLNAFASFVDALRLAADERDRSRPIQCSWMVMSETGQPAPASCGVEVSAHDRFRDPAEFDYVMVVGGLLDHDMTADAAVAAYLRRADEAGVPIIGLCTGVFTMVRAGLMKGRRCCVSWLHYQDLLQATDEVTPEASQLYVVDGNRITCAGGVGSARVAARLIERHVGRDWAQKALSIMMVDGAHGPAGHQPQPPLGLRVGNPRVARAISLLEQSLADPPSIDDLAGAVHISRRQLERGFRRELGMSFGEFSRRLRLDYGLWLVLTTERSVLDITVACGFNGQSHFATLFRRAYGLSPSQARRLPKRQRDRLLEQAKRLVARDQAASAAPDREAGARGK